MIKAFGTRIILEIFEGQPPKAGALILPSKGEYETGRVVAYGSKVDVHIEVGDVVYIHQGTGTDVKANDRAYRCVYEDSVLLAWKEQ